MSKTKNISASSETKSEEGVQLPSRVFSAAEEKALVKKIDRKLIPILFLIYVAAFLDRVNISNALTMKLPEDLHLVNNQKNIALTIFFVPYIIFEIPSNIALKRFSPHVWLSACIGAFGVIMIGQGFVKNYSGLLATRFCLGLAEAGVFPGSFYLISLWYKREESQKRFTVYWCSVLTASMFGSLLATGIANMDGIRGLQDWQWVFILEGIFTCLVAIVAYFMVCDFPEAAKWLSEEERAFVIERAGGNEYAAPITMKDILLFFSDLKHLLGGIMYLAVVVPVYSFAYFSATIIQTLGYSVLQTQAHAVPPVAAALGLTLILAYFSDHTKMRLPFILFGLLIAVIGFAILMNIHNSFGPQYLGICFIAMGAFGVAPIIVCWYIMNLRGHTERAIGTAFQIGFGNTGGIIATFAFLQSDAPYYHTGFSINIGAVCICAFSCLLYGGLVWRDNRKIKAAGGAISEYYSI